MPRVYFDVQIFDRIAKGEIPADIVANINPLIARRKFMAYFSVAHVDEMLGEWEYDQPAALKKFRVARDLVGFENILKQPGDLLIDAIRAYAAGDPIPLPTVSSSQRDMVAANLHRITEGDRSADKVVREVLAHSKTARERFRKEMKVARERTVADFRMRFPSTTSRRQLKFDVFWRGAAELLAMGFADDVGLGEECRRRGTAGLLDVRPVRFATGAMASLIYAQVVGDGLESRHPHIGDGYDLHHALMSSAADMFVTYDKRLADLLDRVPLDSFRVLRSLEELLTV